MGIGEHRPLRICRQRSPLRATRWNSSVCAPRQRQPYALVCW